MAAWTSDTLPLTGACGSTVEQYRFGVLWSISDGPEARPAIAALALDLAEATGTRASSLRFRKTRSVPEGYLSLTCGHYPAVQGDWHVRQHLREAAYEPPLAEGTANLNTIAIASDQPHWCGCRGIGKCPPGESQLRGATTCLYARSDGSFGCMGRLYDQSELNIYGAEDDDDMDAIYRAMDAWEQHENETGADLS